MFAKRDALSLLRVKYLRYNFAIQSTFKLIRPELKTQNREGGLHVSEWIGASCGSEVSSKLNRKISIQSIKNFYFFHSTFLITLKLN